MRNIYGYQEAKKRKLHFDKSLGIESGIVKIPDTLFMVHNKQLSVFCIEYGDPLIENSELYYSPYLNVNGEGLVCLGNVKTKDKFQYFEDMIYHWEQCFWNSIFTHSQNNNAVKGDIIKLWKESMDSELFLFSH